MNTMILPPPVNLLPRRKTLDDVPQTQLSHMTVKLYLVGALVWDYTDTVLDIAAQMRIGGATKKVSRVIRELRKDYDYIRSKDLDRNHIKCELKLARQFENINEENFSRLCNGLLTEIRHDTTLDKDYVLLVEAVQMAMTIIDTMKLFAVQCDKFIRKFYPTAPHSILPDHFEKLSILIPEFAGDCYDRHSQSRYITARILLNEINKIELYGD